MGSKIRELVPAKLEYTLPAAKGGTRAIKKTEWISRITWNKLTWSETDYITRHPPAKREDGTDRVR